VVGDGGADKHTLAHELTHVIQQSQGPVSGADNGAGLSISDPGDRYEREAEANATRVMAGSPPVQAVRPAQKPVIGGAGAVQRYSVEPDQHLRFTENVQYLLDGQDEDYRAPCLWVRDGAQAPRYCRPTKKKRNVDGAKFVAYVPVSQFYADCVQTAEEVMNERQLPLGGDNIFIHEAALRMQFGGPKVLTEQLAALVIDSEQPPFEWCRSAPVSSRAPARTSPSRQDRSRGWTPHRWTLATASSTSMPQPTLRGFVRSSRRWMPRLSRRTTHES
jgi:hypothetical protein